MSRRQINRLKSDKYALSLDQPDEEDDYIENRAVVADFSLLGESDSDEIVDEVSPQLEEEATDISIDNKPHEIIHQAKVRSKSKKNQESLSDDFNSHTVALFNETKLLSVKSLNFDLDEEIQRKLRLPVDHRRTARSLASSRLLFVKPKSDWPTLIRSNVRLIQCNEPDYVNKLPKWQREVDVVWFCFQFSSSYTQAQAQFEVARSSMNPDYLKQFASQNPNHIDCLLTLSSMFSDTGNESKSYDYLQQAAFVLTNACMSCDAFSARGRVKCRLDPTRASNASLFACLYKFIRASHRLRLSSLGADFCRFTLSLEPLLDPYFVLLWLDSFLVSDNNKKMFDLFYIDGFPIGCCPDGDDIKLLVNDLPNWALSSVVLSCINKEPESNDKMYDFLYRFPFSLNIILSKLGWLVSNGNDDSHQIEASDWNSLLDNAIFSNSAIDLTDSSPFYVVIHILNIYLEINSAIWITHKDALSVCLFTASSRLLIDSNSSQHWLTDCSVSTRDHFNSVYNSSSSIQKYRNARISDFVEHITPIPDVGQVEEEVQHNENRLEQAGLGNLLETVDDETLSDILANLGHTDRNQIDATRRNAPRSGLSPNLPLTQLFWMLALPWNHLSETTHDDDDDDDEDKIEGL